MVASCLSKMKTLTVKMDTQHTLQVERMALTGEGGRNLTCFVI
jgi:hypothetical protein